MTYKTGARLKSSVDTTEAVVVRLPSSGVIACGGAAMIPFNETSPEGGTVDPTFASGSVMGKRYFDEESGLEMLCTKSGEGALSIDGRPLALREAKALPSSD